MTSPAPRNSPRGSLGHAETHRHPGVDAYIEALPDWRGDLCSELRELIHAAEPEIDETIKRRVQPYFVLQGNVCALLVSKNHVNLFLYDGAIVADPHHLITGGHNNTTARTIAFHQDFKIPTRPLTTMLRQIAANNRAGGWRTLKSSR